MTTKSVSLTYLLSIYLVIPIVLTLVWLDKSFFGSSIMQALPFIPETWILWVYVFGLPHLFAGFNMFADKEYLKFYGWKLLIITVVFMALPLVVMNTMGSKAMFFIFVGFIVYHTISQQFGIAIVAMKQRPAKLFLVWKWSALGVSAILYVMLYQQPIPLALDLFNPYRAWLVNTSSVLIIIFAISGFLLMWKSSNKIGAAHVFANMALISCEVILFHTGYFLFMVLVGRVVHEMTAWHIYATHDSNRSAVGKPNLIIKALSFTKLPVYVLSIFAAFLIGFIVTYSASLFTLGASLIVSLSLLHYYSESFLWKNGTIHRHNLSFTH